MILDFIFYIVILALLFWLTRVRPCREVSVQIGDLKLSGKVLVCESQLTSRVGLLNTPALSAGSGLLLTNVKSIHTIGMTFPIDIIFLDDAMRILDTASEIAPGVRLLKGPSGTRSVLELGAGTLNLLAGKIEKYTKIVISDIPIPLQSPRSDR